MRCRLPRNDSNVWPRRSTTGHVLSSPAADAQPAAASRLASCAEIDAGGRCVRRSVESARRQEVGECVDGLVLMTAPHDHVQVVRASFLGFPGTRAANQDNVGLTSRSGAIPISCDGRRGPRAAGGRPNRRSASTMRTAIPRSGTDCYWHSIGAARPLTAERCEALHVLDAGDRDGVRLHHAAAPRPRPDICRAM